ncbi:hypothetical protein [Marinigracilibium pacificum]|uniref:Outer membrane beta-barrel porin/alpha-amylase n=1 Tax=Marinigracilibium pacificum TaxID=2729599 RepID=A0A848J594_9BACT|nr:hypothetical protein [Marinigracilibium pacificum]NMM48322.1 hypothetical protein [Marinigracilibium pacificum]
MKKLIIIILFLIMQVSIMAQQFVGDNQWVAPHGVATIVGTAGQEYAQFYAIAALFPDWEFNTQFVHYYDDPRSNSESYTSFSFFVKHRLVENDAQTEGYSVLAGLGLFPQHLDEGEVTSEFQSYWAMFTATYAFANNTILWDILPGATVNFDHKQTKKTAWGFTYSTRIAIYKVIPQSAIVGEIFGTAGAAESPASYRAGIRWESPKLVVALSYSNAFNGSYGAGFEIGAFFFTNPLFGKNRIRK